MVIKLTNVSKVIKKAKVLDNVNLEPIVPVHLLMAVIKGS